jgi:hypothetical protein
MKEEWRFVKGYKGLYKVSTKGRIKSLDRIKLSRLGNPYIFKGKLLKGKTRDEDGYAIVGLTNRKGKLKNKKVHRLVAIAFIPNPKNKPEVNHKNGIKDDNVVINLEWTTTKENADHAIKTGLVDHVGPGNGNSKLNENMVRRIKQLLNKGKSCVTIAKRMDVSPCLISFIKQGRNWRHVNN